MPKVIASAPNAGGRHQRGRRVGTSLAEINVIPLVDVMLVLLIIFFLFVEPHGLARLWELTKEKLRLWPFPH